MSTSQTAESTTVISIENLEFLPSEDEDKRGVEVATLDWFDLIQAKVFKYPKGHTVSLHHLSGQILLTILKGEVEFKEKDRPGEIAKAGSFRKCGGESWESRVIEESYILVIEENDTKTLFD